MQVIVDKYSVDEDKGEILRGDTLEFDKNTTDNKWTVTGIDVETESVKDAPVNDLAKT